MAADRSDRDLPRNERVHVILPGTAGTHSVRVGWVCDSPGPFERPRLELPTLEQPAVPAAVWAVELPTGYRANLPPRP